MLGFGLGVPVGARAVAIGASQALPNMTLEVRERPHDTVEETCDRLAATIEEKGWSNQALRSMNGAMAKHDVQMDRPPTRRLIRPPNPSGDAPNAAR